MGKIRDGQNTAGDLAKSWRLKFSIRTMLIVVTVIAVGLGGTRLWVLWNTKYKVTGFLEVDEELPRKIEGGWDWREHAKIFGYVYVDRGPNPDSQFNDPLVDDASIKYRPYLVDWATKRVGAAYSVDANYFTINQKIAKLKLVIKSVADRNPDIRFPKYKIQTLNTMGFQKNIDEGDPREDLRDDLVETTK